MSEQKMKRGAFYVSRRSFTYGTTNLIPGQLVKVGGQPNDEKLIRIEYLRIFNAAVTGKPLPCRVCGELFETERDRMRHGSLIHEPKRENPYMRQLRAREYALDPVRMGRPRTDMEQHEIDQLGEMAARFEDKQVEDVVTQENKENPLNLEKTSVARGIDTKNPKTPEVVTKRRSAKKARGAKRKASRAASKGGLQATA